MAEISQPSWKRWIDAYELVYEALPAESHVLCPRCGQDALRLVFTGRDASRRTGYASFWCDNCLFGIHLSQCPVPEGVPILSIDLSSGDRATIVPNYTIIPPEIIDTDDVDSEVF